MSHARHTPLKRSNQSPRARPYRILAISPVDVPEVPTQNLHFALASPLSAPGVGAEITPTVSSGADYVADAMEP